MSSTVGYATLQIIPSARGFQANLAKQTAAPMRQAGTQAGQQFSTGMRSSTGTFLRGFGGTLAAFGVAKLIKNSVELEAAYSTTLRKIGVATNAPKNQLQRLDDLAIKLGQDTVFSANDSAEAMLELAKGGLSPAAIEAGALSNALTLAAAGDLDLATASTTVVRAMGAFHLTGRQSAEAVTALAGAATASSIDVSDLAQSLSQAGGEAASVGFSIAETTGVLAAFGDAGIVGSDAGTSLRTMLTRLVPQTDKARKEMDKLHLSFTDANGEFDDAETIAQKLQRSFKGLTDEERSHSLGVIFGADARRAANVLIDEGSKGLEKYVEASKDQEQAEKLAKAGMEGTKGAMEQLSGAWETAQLQLGKGLAPLVEDLANALTDFLANHDIEQGAKDLVGFIQDLGEDIKPLVDLAGDLAGGFGELPGPVKKFGIEIALAALAVGKLRSATSGSFLARFATDMKSAETRMARLGSAARTAGGAGGLLLLTQGVQESNDALGTLELAAGGALTGFAVGGPWGAAIGGGAGALVGLAKSFTSAGDEAGTAAPKIADFINTLDPLTQKATQATRRLAAEALEDSGLLQLGKTAGIKGSALVDAIVGSPADLKAATARIDDTISGIDAKIATARAGIADAIKAQNAAIDTGDSSAFTSASDRKQELNEQIEGYEKQQEALERLTGSLSKNRDALKEDRAEAQRLAEAAGERTVDLKKYRDVLESLPKKASTAFRQEGIEISRRRAKQLIDQYDLMPKEAKILLSTLGYDQTKNQLDSTRRNADNLDGKEVKVLISTIQQTLYRRGPGGQQGNVDNADGNLISAYANGGIRENHVAQMAKAGAYRLWAEPETGGESYIPLAPSKRQRSLKIWRETGRELGVQGYADGGMTGGRRSAPPVVRFDKNFGTSFEQWLSEVVAEHVAYYAAGSR